MPFTEEEKRAWHEQKRAREQRPQPSFRSQPIAICLHCHQPFGMSEGTMTDEVAICDTCLGD